MADKGFSLVCSTKLLWKKQTVGITAVWILFSDNPKISYAEWPIDAFLMSSRYSNKLSGP